MSGLMRGVAGVIMASLAMVALVVVVGAAGVPAMGASEPTDRVRTVQVEPGDTLWGYAEDIAEPGQDVRDVVVRLKQLNGLDSSALRVGQRIVLPVDGFDR